MSIDWTIDALKQIPTVLVRNAFINNGITFEPSKTVHLSKWIRKEFEAMVRSTSTANLANAELLEDREAEENESEDRIYQELEKDLLDFDT